MDAIVTFQGNTLLFSGPKSLIDRLCALVGHLGCERSVPRSWFGQMMDFHVLDLGDEDAVALYELARFEADRLNARVPQDPPQDVLLSDFRQGFLYLEGPTSEVEAAMDLADRLGMSHLASRSPCRRVWRADFPRLPELRTAWLRVGGWRDAEAFRDLLRTLPRRPDGIPTRIAATA